MSVFTHAVSTNNYGPAKFIVSANAYEGTHTTIASALTSASSGDTIFIRPGTYTENLTLKAGVNLTAYGSDGIASGQGSAITPNVIIKGTVTATYTGSVTLNGIQLLTNGAAAITNSGSNAANLILNNCSLYAFNATGMTLSGTATNFDFYNCTFNNASANILFTCKGNLNFQSCFIGLNSGSSASTIDVGNVQFTGCYIKGLPISTTTTGSIQMNSCFWSYAGTTLLTTSGTGQSFIYNSELDSNSASTISIGSGTIVNVVNCSLTSGNTNVITGAGTLKSGNNVFTSTSSTVNPSTNTLLPVSEIYSPNGITFDNSNILSNYATGTYTPTLNGSTPGTTTYSQQNGYYTRIGNLVTVNGYIQLSAATGTGNVILGGLPFTIKNQTNGYPVGNILLFGGASWPYPAGGSSPAIQGLINTTTAQIVVNGSGISAANLQMTNNALLLVYTLTYQI